MFPDLYALNIPAIASAATAVVIGYLAAGTQKIRIGAGGIMLPNHAPLVIAEQFGTLESIYPGRIDIGLGRAPGTSDRTLGALRRDGSEAARFGLPYAFASHFAPDALMQALEAYRSSFQPSEQLQKPYVMVSANVVVADSDDEARRQFTTVQQSFTNMVRRQPGLIPPPIPDIDAYWSDMEKWQVSHMLQVSVVGNPERVRRELENLRQTTQADEIMAVASLFDHAARLRSYELLASL